LTEPFCQGVLCWASEDAVKPTAFSVAALFFASLLQAVLSFGLTVDPPAQEPLRIDGVAGFIHLLNKPDLVYPTEALEQHIEGKVELELTVSPQGDVVSERAVWGPSVLRQATIDAFKKVKYIPFDRDGKPSVALVRAIVVYEKDHAEMSTESEHAIPQLQTPVMFNNEYKTGKGGDFGLGTGAHGRQMGNLEILSDTYGVDFGPYLGQVVLAQVRKNWYNAIPQSEQRKHGSVVIEFAITKDGRVAKMRLVQGSGDVPLDRAAWAGIVGSDPFPALPGEFGGQYLALRIRFIYNPAKEELAPAEPTASTPVAK
jgi:TonB family protein